jgi:hypothetical protein
MRRSASWLLVIAMLLLSECATGGIGPRGTAAADTTPNGYTRLGLSQSGVEPWEDGMRTSGEPGTYEWWYFDFTLDDGSTVVIVYYTKDFTRPGTKLTPFVTFQMNSPDGTTVKKVLVSRPEEFRASRDRCDVRVGASTVSGDLHDYTLHLEAGGIRADMSLHGTVPPWRPGTGRMVFRRGSEHYFAWLPSVPQGTAEGTITVAGATRTVHGVGYHDHNWGDVSMLDLIHDWYWGRAQVGPYTVIASYITARSEYGSAPIPLFMLARDGQIVVDDSSKVHFSTNGGYMDSFTGKPVADTLVYDYGDAGNGYRVTFHREKDIDRTRFIDLVTGFPAFLARLAGFDGAYLRFTGPATVERTQDGKTIETETERSAVWELMYFGHAPRE